MYHIGYLVLVCESRHVTGLNVDCAVSHQDQ